jgi:hypothetical protein
MRHKPVHQSTLAIDAELRRRIDELALDRPRDDERADGRLRPTLARWGFNEWS